jgi:fatty acid-binding protein DegV
MQVGLLVDSACDLPYSFIRDNDIFILPITVHLDGETIVDDHDPDRVREVYRSGLLSRGHAADTEPYSTEQIHQLPLEKVVTHYDFAFLETVAASRSNIFANATEAMNRTMTDYRPYRKEAGREGAFSMRVVDSGTIFAAQGVLAAHTIHLIKQGIPKQELRRQVSDFRQYIYGALVPRDIYYIRKRARARGDKSVSGLTAFLSKTLNINPVVWAQGADSQAAKAFIEFLRGPEAAPIIAKYGYGTAASS